MKTVFLLFALIVSMSGSLMISSAAEAREVSCGGKCVKTGEDKWFQANCEAGAENETSCDRFSSFGCKWQPFEKKVVRKSLCMNVTNDRTLDQTCAKTEMQNEKSCLAVSRCVWSPAAVACLR